MRRFRRRISRFQANSSDLRRISAGVEQNRPYRATSFLHVVALDEAGISTVADLKGKCISVGSAGSSTEIAANRVIEAAGLNPTADITRCRQPRIAGRRLF